MDTQKKYKSYCVLAPKGYSNEIFLVWKILFFYQHILNPNACSWRKKCCLKKESRLREVVPPMCFYNPKFVRTITTCQHDHSYKEKCEYFARYKKYGLLSYFFTHLFMSTPVFFFLIFLSRTHDGDRELRVAQHDRVADFTRLALAFTDVSLPRCVLSVVMYLSFTSFEASLELMDVLRVSEDADREVAA